MKDWQPNVIYSENPTDQLFVANDHPESSPDGDLTSVEVDRGRHEVLVKNLLHIRIGVFLFILFLYCL